MISRKNQNRENDKKTSIEFLIKRLNDEDDNPRDKHINHNEIIGQQIDISIPDYLRPYPRNVDSCSLDEVVQELDETFSEMLLRIIDEKGMKDSAVYKRANIDRRLFSKIRSESDYVPSKKTVLAFVFALQLNLDEAKDLLERAGYALSTASRFDVIITWLIKHKEYNINFVNIVLDEYGEDTLNR